MTFDRRGFLAACGRAGITSALMPGILYTLAVQAEEASGQAAGTTPGTDGEKPPVITAEMIDRAAELAGVGPFSDEQKKMMIDGLTDQNGRVKAIRKLNLPNSVPPAFVFQPRLAMSPCGGVAPGNMLQLKPWSQGIDLGKGVGAAPARMEDLAFATVHELAKLIKARKVSSVDLTKMYLDRLNRYDPKLHFKVTLTEERALKQAAEADAEIAAGKYRGPLHGIPWGAKDLLAVKGYPTTWGAGGFAKQVIDEDATAVQRLDAAGAVLVAKLTLGALAMGDKWFGGQTRNPWNVKQGSSGSSAGPASAVAAGCVGFAIGSETLGSIAAPSTRCGASGLRPTFGFVPRTGAMALSWTMDKLGPICRSAEDCALVMESIHGPDGKDASVASNADFSWTPVYDDRRWARLLRVGYLKSAFDALPSFTPPEPKVDETAEEKKRRERSAAQRARRDYDRRYDTAALDQLKAMGVNLIPVELPKLPYGAMVPLLTAEAAAAFDDLTLSGRDKLLTEQGADDWPNAFRVSRFYSAVDYIQANRARTLAVQQMSALFNTVDIIVTPTSGMQLVATNLTGHPALIVPNGLRGADAPHSPAMDSGEEEDIGGPHTPVSITFLAGLYEDSTLVAFGRAYQEATGFHLVHPEMD